MFLNVLIAFDPDLNRKLPGPPSSMGQTKFSGMAVFVVMSMVALSPKHNL